MIGPQTFLKAVALSLALTTSASATGDLHMIFAACAGRTSAELEHTWLTVGHGNPQTELIGQRETFASRFEATRPLGDAKDAFHHRVAAKMVQARLLTLASFSDDPARAARARALATTEMARCRRLLLDS